MQSIQIVIFSIDRNRCVERIFLEKPSAWRSIFHWTETALVGASLLVYSNCLICLLLRIIHSENMGKMAWNPSNDSVHRKRSTHFRHSFSVRFDLSGNQSKKWKIKFDQSASFAVWIGVESIGYWVSQKTQMDFVHDLEDWTMNNSMK